MKKIRDVFNLSKDTISRHIDSLDLNLLIYSFNRYRWKLDLKRYFSDFNNVTIDRPIFLLGTKGSGLTLITRMFRRNKQIVSVSGNYKYWSGPDEMHSVLGSILPSPLKAPEHLTPYPRGIRIAHGGHTGMDKYVDHYRSSEAEATPDTKKEFRKIIRWIISKRSLTESSRFIDKSQLYTIKVPLLSELLKDCDPKFILVSRNPYAFCFREAKSEVYTKNRLTEKFDYEERLRFSCQYWLNYHKFALSDGENVDDFLHVKFEDILRDPEDKLKEMCKFVELSFDHNMIPSPDDDIPLGTKSPKKWAPLRPNVNEKYLKKITSKDIKIISKTCGDLASKIGYRPPS